MAATNKAATAAGASPQDPAAEPGERRADYRQNPYTLVYDRAITKNERSPRPPGRRTKSASASRAPRPS